MTKKEGLSSTRLEEWKKSGLSQRRYCEERQLSLSTFRWWRSRLREPGSSAGQPTSFVELPVPQTSKHEAAENGPPIMLTVPGKQARVLVRPGPTDMRKQINGLAVLVEQELELNLFSEVVFLFCKRERRILKALFWDRTGFCLWHKRLEKHRFPWPERTQGRLFDEAEVAAAGDLCASGLLVISSSLTPMAAGPSRRRKSPTRHRPRNAPNRRLTRKSTNLDLSRKVELAAQR